MCSVNVEYIKLMFEVPLLKENPAAIAVRGPRVSQQSSTGNINTQTESWQNNLPSGGAKQKVNEKYVE